MVHQLGLTVSLRQIAPGGADRGKLVRGSTPSPTAVTSYARPTPTIAARIAREAPAIGDVQLSMSSPTTTRRLGGRRSPRRCSTRCPYSPEEREGDEHGDTGMRWLW